ncbi:MAG: type I methionyl aminopeptidase [Micromonosporaceae bacterium]|nr:type I methionyl aminopeptidase [Micromonosporaceae bacterium]
MRAAGLVVARTLAVLREAARPGVSTGELDALAEATIRSEGAVPSFKGYQGFPATICASVNDRVVHAIPSRDEVLSDGDLISIDCGAILDGWHGDSAITVPIGDVEPDLLEMLRVVEDSLWAGIAAARPDGRLTNISHAIETTIRDLGPYGIVEGYGGHGIGTEMHQEPHIHNHGRAGRGPRMTVGMAFAIEPMITWGSPEVVELDDGWTVVTLDESVAVHVEHSMAICDDGIWVLTAFDGGRERLGDLVTARQR